MHPQIGYNVYGVQSTTVDDYNQDSKFHGIILSACTGYLFYLGNTNFDIGLRYETILANGSNMSYIGLRFAHSIFGNRRNDY